MQKVKVLIFVAVVFVAALVSVLFEDTIEQRKNDYYLENNYEDVYRTTAHVDMSMYSNLELLYLDKTNDIAYYRYLSDWRFANVGDVVQDIYGDQCKIIATDCYGFVIETSTQFTQGMSGTAILCDDVQIGYISEQLNTGNVRCIWYIP